MIREGDFLHGELLERSVLLPDENVIQVRCIFHCQWLIWCTDFRSQDSSSDARRNDLPESQSLHEEFHFRGHEIEVSVNTASRVLVGY